MSPTSFRTPVTLALLASLTLPINVLAQTAAGDGDIVAFGKQVIGVFQRRVHPVVKTVAPGGWLGAGMGYDTSNLWNTRGFASLEGVFTLRRYWSTHANVGVQGNRYRAEAYARARDMKRLDLYGLGNETTRDDRTTFRLQDRELGGLASVRFGGVSVGGRLESLWPDLEPGQHPDYPSFEERFTEQTLPGAGAQPRLTRYQSFISVSHPYAPDVPRTTGGDYQLGFSYFRDSEQDRHSFRRLTGEIQQRIRGVRQDQRLTLHALVTTTYAADGNSVPFYYQETLGGAGAVRGFRDDIIGTDGSRATLRGFGDLRFRGPHLLLLQAEYRWRVRGPIDATAFVDAGKVATSRGDLDLTGLHGNYGFSVSAMARGATAFRVDLGLGGEGAHVFFGIAPVFAR